MLAGVLSGVRRNTVRKFALLSYIALLCSLPLSADVITLDAMDSGWYSSSGNLDSKFIPGNTNYFAGYTPNQPDLESPGWRNYFSFDLGGVSNTIAAAWLYLPNLGTNMGAPVTYDIYEVNTPAATLAGATGAGSAVIYNDLGSGPTYGGVVVPTNTTDPVVIQLNSDGLAAINNALGGSLVVGGAVVDLGDNADRYLFTGGPGAIGPQLVLSEVPEPGTAAMAIAGLGIVLFSLRRRS
jgi:hypothetical protein